MSKAADRVLLFAPEFWGQAERFQRFYFETYSFDQRQQRALAGVTGHFVKAQRLRLLAERLRPNLTLDAAEMEEKGYTSADNASELATIIEAVILELYSSIDCTRQVLYAIYGKNSQGFRDSTRSFFQKASEITGALPDNIKQLVTGAGWYYRLLYLRDELTHLAPGQCHFNDETGLVWYVHHGIKEHKKPLIVDDVFGWLSITSEEVNSFLGAIFHHLNATLNDNLIQQFCGFVEGRILHRYVSPVGELTFNSGHCGAYVWFEKPEHPTCPFANTCGAYQRKMPSQGLESDT